MRSKQFKFYVPVNKEGVHVGDVIISAIAAVHSSGELRGCYIEGARFLPIWMDKHVSSYDIASYVLNAHPETWAEWIAAAENNYKSLYETKKDGADNPNGNLPGI